MPLEKYECNRKDSPCHGRVQSHLQAKMSGSCKRLVITDYDILLLLLWPPMEQRRGYVPWIKDQDLSASYLSFHRQMGLCRRCRCQFHHPFQKPQKNSTQDDRSKRNKKIEHQVICAAIHQKSTRGFKTMILPLSSNKKLQLQAIIL